MIAPRGKAGGKGKKGKGKNSGKNSGVKKPLFKAVKRTGPGGEEADDDTCWEMKHTGKCPRMERGQKCKWAPCCDMELPVKEENPLKDLDMGNDDVEMEEAKGKNPMAQAKGNNKTKWDNFNSNKFVQRGNDDRKGKGKKGAKGKDGKGKGKKGKGKGEKKPLVGPDGETADDETCWELKHTGKCPRFPCKWKPCADLPKEDTIFEGAKEWKKRF